MVLPVLEEGGPAGCQQPVWGCRWQFCPACPCVSTAVLCSSPHITPVPASSDTVPTLCPAPCLGAAENSPPGEQDWASKTYSLCVSSKIRFLWNLCLQVLLRGMLKLLWADTPHRKQHAPLCPVCCVMGTQLIEEVCLDKPCLSSLSSLFCSGWHMTMPQSRF